MATTSTGRSAPLEPPGVRSTNAVTTVGAEGATAPRSSFGSTLGSVRRWGVVLLALVFSESVLGILAAGPLGPLMSAVLIAHLALGAGVTSLAGWATRVAFRGSYLKAKFASALTFVAIASTASVGAIFLALGNSSGGDLDRALALVALAGTVLMIAWGSGGNSRRVPRPPK